jgi:hypothetical protein
MAAPEHSPAFDTPEQRAERFTTDFRNLCGHVREFAAKHDMMDAMPTLVFGPQWVRPFRLNLRRTEGIDHRFGNGASYMGVTIRFGGFRNGQVAFEECN